MTVLMQRLLVVALFVTLLVNLGVFLEDPVNPSDFAVFYRAALLVSHGKTAQVYDKNAQEQAGWLHSSHVGYFYHPFFEMPLFLPFTLFSYRVSFWIWSAISAGLVALSAWRLGKLVRSPVHPLLLSFAFFPVLLLLSVGQDSAFLLLLFVLAFDDWEQDRNLTCGIYLGLALIRFQYAIPLLALLFMRRRSKALVAGFGATVVTMLGGWWMAAGTSGLVSYWQILRNHDAQNPVVMFNLRGLISLGHVGEQSLVVIACSVLFGLWLVTRTGITDRLYFGAAVAVSVLTSYHGLGHDAVILIIPLLMALDQGEKWVWIFWIEPLYFLLARIGLLALFAIPIACLAWRLVSSHARNIRVLRAELVPPRSQVPDSLG